jgi:hypothetical protein
MNPPSPAPRRAISAAVGALILLGAGLLAWHISHPAVGREDVALFLGKTVEGGRFRFSVETIDGVQSAAAGLRLHAVAKASPLQPLYTRLDTADYLQKAYQLDPGISADARALLEKPGAPDPEAMAAGPLPADPFQATILEATSPVGVTYAYECVVDARRQDGAWVLSLASGGFTGPSPRGEPRTGAGTLVFVQGDAADGARLRAAVAEFQGFVGRLANARRSAEMAHVAAIATRRIAFLALVAPGHVFRGQATRSGEQNATALTLEIVELTADHEVTALLRNDGSWRSARLFQGTWSADDEFTAPVVSLASTAGQAVRGAGPFLENTQNWTLELRVREPVGLVGQNGFYQYQFHLMAPGQVAELKDRLEEEFTRSLSATESGLLYQGTAVSRSTGVSEPILLRFTNRSENGDSIAASIESPSRSWKRPLHGSVFGNSRRSGGEPIRLHSGAEAAAPDAPPASVLGDRDDLQVRLGFDGSSLTGEDDQFTYRLAPAGESDLRRLEAERLARAQRFRLAVRSGISYDGTLHEEQGFVSRARLEITRMDRDTGAIAASIRSLSRPGVHREFLGACDPSASSFSLVATPHGDPGKDDAFDVPFLKGASPATLHLTLSGNAITGSIEGDTSWALAFPAGVFLSAPTESPEPGGPPANGGALPAFPKAGGAYVLAKGAWVPLPRNGGHVATEMVREKGGDLHLPTNLVGAMDEAISQLSNVKEKRKVTYLVFDGKDPRPESSSTSMVILFAGEAPKSSPPVALAPTQVGKDGQRRIEVPENASTQARFGEQAVAGFVRSAGPGYILFTSTAQVEPGTYAFSADAAYEVAQD